MTTSVVLLGTGTPRTEVGRSGPATAVIVEDRPYIFDFGAGVTQRISEGHARGIGGLAMSRIERAFLTHMHSDHTVGLPALMLTPWMFGREEPLVVHGPLGTSAMALSVADTYALDVAKRRYSEPHTDRGHEIVGHDVVPGLVYEDDLVAVEAIAVQHGDWDESVHGPYPALGYRIRTADRTVVISGDTGPFLGMEESYGACDVLVHEVYSGRGLAQRPAEWREYHERSHMSATHLGEVASVVGPGTLVLTHQLLWLATADDLLDEIGAQFDGTIVYGRDLDVV